jgi:predicted nucleotide-binding protein
MKPRIFIASSIEGRNVADGLEIGLQHDADCTAWHEAFPLSQYTIDTLLKQCADNDFAVFVFSPDDRAQIRSDKYDIARDNVLFESGLFMGMHGKDRGFIAMPRDNPAFHLPTDLLGFTTRDMIMSAQRKNQLQLLEPLPHRFVKP